MSDRQYRTLGEGDRRLPECEYDEGRQGRWNPCPPCMIGERISRVDADAAAYRVPCNATVAPDGYEVVDPARLPEDARVGATWLRREPEDDKWSGMRGGWGWVMDTTPRRIVYAAPADELCELYAQGDAERAGAAISEALAADAEKLADWLRQKAAPQGDAEREQPAQSVAYRIAREFRDRYEHVSRSVGWQTQEACRTWFDQLPEVNLRAMIKTVECLLKAGVIAPGTAFEMWPVEQHAPTAPASPWVYVGDRLPPVNVRVVVSTAPRGDDPRPSVVLTWSGERWYRDGVWYSGAVHWLDLAAVDRLAAENAELLDAAIEDRDYFERERDEARAEVERLRGELHRITAAVNEMIRGSYEAGIAVLAAARAALEGRDG